MGISVKGHTLVPGTFTGYKDCGGFVVDVPGYEQPMEMIMIKAV